MMNFDQMTDAQIERQIEKMQMELSRRNAKRLHVEWAKESSKREEFFKSQEGENRWDWNNPVTLSDIDSAERLLKEFPDGDLGRQLRRVFERAELFGIVDEEYECDHCQDGVGGCENCNGDEE